MKKCNKIGKTALAALFAAGVLSLTGCGKTGDDSKQADTAVSHEISEAEPKSAESQTDVEVQASMDTARTQGSSMMRAYSDMEKERMAELEQSYQNETTKPEKMIQEVDIAESVTEGTLCYIRSTGEYYLPDRELTDEELLEIIDCNSRIAVNSQGWTQEKIDEAERRDRALLEEKVTVAGGISEDEAIEIARRAMEADIGEKAKELEVCIYPELTSNGWKLHLWDITDWDEYKDKGDIAYSVHFGNKEDVVDPKDFFNYNCFVNAVDGSICGAYSISGDVGLYWDVDDFVWYEH
ncbi:MAG: hypothetical protein K2I96_16115 [Lachnospiraceae bacterium]|nr:hypothetical protein [Lachnospiraceae bacterium]